MLHITSQLLSSNYVNPVLVASNYVNTALVTKRYFSSTKSSKADSIRDMDESPSALTGSELEYKPHYFKEKFRKQAMMNNFLLNNVVKGNANASPEEMIERERVDLIDEERQINHSLSQAKQAKAATLRLMRNETPNKPQYLGLKSMWENFTSFFSKDSNTIPDLVESDPLMSNIGAETASDYLKSELRVNKDRQITLKMWQKDDRQEKLEQSKLESEKIKQSLESEESKGKRKYESSSDEDSSSAKKSKTPTVDFVDSLPQDYSPLENAMSESD